MNPESIIQNEIRCALSPHGIVIRMNTGVFETPNGNKIKCGITGCPDLLFIGHKGQTVWLEVKTPKGAVSKEQERFIATLREYGHKAHVVRTVAGAIRYAVTEYE